MKKGSNWRQCKNPFYKIYLSYYSEELLNLCWYCWGGVFFSCSLILLLSLSEILTSGFRPWALVFIRTWSDLLLHKYLVSRKTNQFSLHYLHQQRRNLLSCFDTYNFIFTYKSARWVIVCYHQIFLLRYLFLEISKLCNSSILISN